jgi:hypothetical protein
MQQCISERRWHHGSTSSPRALNRPFVLPSLLRGGDTSGRFFDGNLTILSEGEGEFNCRSIPPKPENEGEGGFVDENMKLDCFDDMFFIAGFSTSTSVMLRRSRRA